MTEFELPLLYSYIVSGYRYLLYYNVEHFALIVPMREICDTEEEGSYVVAINDEQHMKWQVVYDPFARKR